VARGQATRECTKAPRLSPESELAQLPALAALHHAKAAPLLRCIRTPSLTVVRMQGASPLWFVRWNLALCFCASRARAGSLLFRAGAAVAKRQVLKCVAGPHVM